MKILFATCTCIVQHQLGKWCLTKGVFVFPVTLPFPVAVRTIVSSGGLGGGLGGGLSGAQSAGLELAL